MRKLVVTISIIFLIFTICYADDIPGFFWAASRTGGGEALDGIDGQDLVDGYTAIVNHSSGTYFYVLDDDSGAVESDPTVISPDTNAGDKRWLLTAYIGSNTVSTLANDATPSISAGNKFVTGGTTTITDFDDGFTGKIIYILSQHSITITDGTNIFLNGSGSWNMQTQDTLTLIQKSDGTWHEIARSDN